MTETRQLRRARARKVGVALGSGGARGWAHVGVLQALLELGIVPRAIAGTSMGALVGGIYAADGLERLADLAGRLDWIDILYHFWDPSFRLSGLVDGKKVSALIRRFVGTREIQDLPVPYVAIATDLYTGEEVRLKEGDLIDAIRASIAVPALFTPVETDSKLLVDGGLVNPVPCDAARELGAEFVIGVELNLRNFDRSFPGQSFLVGSFRKTRKKTASGTQGARAAFVQRLEEFLRAARQNRPRLRGSSQRRAALTMVDILGRSLRVLEGHLAEHKLREHPPDVLIQPDLQDIGFVEHHRASEIIRRGYQATLQAFGM